MIVHTIRPFFRFLADAVKKKWKNLRDSFGKELRKIPVGRSGDEGPSNLETYTTWPHFNAMLFLRDQMKPRKAGGNLSVSDGGNLTEFEDTQEAENHQECDAGTISYELNESNCPDTYEVEYVAEIPQASTQPSNKMRKRSVLQEKLVDIEARKLKLLEKRAKKSSNAEEDEDEAFFKSLLPHVRKLAPEEKLEFRMDVQRLVQKHVYSKSRLLNSPNTLNVHRTPLQSPAPVFEITPPPPPTCQSTPTIREQAEYDLTAYHNELMATENQFSAVSPAERRHYSVITSPISSVVSHK